MYYLHIFCHSRNGKTLTILNIETQKMSFKILNWGSSMENLECNSSDKLASFNQT